MRLPDVSGRDIFGTQEILRVVNFEFVYFSSLIMT